MWGRNKKTPPLSDEIKDCEKELAAAYKKNEAASDALMDAILKDVARRLKERK